MPTYDRRSFLQLSGQGLGLSAFVTLLPSCGGDDSSGSEAPAPSPTPTPDPGPQAVLPAPAPEVLMLKRTSFGPSKASHAEIQALGIPGYLEQQLNPQSIDTTALENTVAQRYPRTLQSIPVQRAGFPDNQQSTIEQLLQARLLRAFTSPAQLYETMVEFWLDHFNVDLRNGVASIFHGSWERDTIRAHTLGAFRDLLGATARAPAMLYYLDNFLNVASSPQENYARELLELHTLGVDGGYTETDIKEVARCFTGWTLDRETGEFRYLPAIHDNGSKVVLGQFIPAGGGQSDVETVLDILATHPATARHLATKLCRRYIGDTPPIAAIDAVEQSFVATKGDIRSCLRTLLQSAEFAGSAEQKFARPMEFLGQMWRAMPPASGFPQGNDARILLALLDQLGQAPYFWPAPNGYPDIASYWASTSGLLNRWRQSLLPNVPQFSNLVDVHALLGEARTQEDMVIHLEAGLLFRSLSDTDRELVLSYLQEQTGFASTTELPASAISTVGGLTASLLMSSVYFQLR